MPKIFLNGTRGREDFLFNQLAVAKFFYGPRLHAARRLQQPATHQKKCTHAAPPPMRPVKRPCGRARPPPPNLTLSTRARAPQVVEANAGLGVQFG
jgi:hypothetical protein